MTNKEIENKRNELIRIVKMSSGTEPVRLKKLRDLAVEVGTSHKSMDGQKNANEGELVFNIQTALQTASMLNACKATTTAWIVALCSTIVALFATLASIISAIAAWVAVLIK